MSFGYSVGDFVMLAQLAWTVVDNSRKACGEHDELAREVNHLHMVLQRLSDEVSKPDSILSKDKDDRVDDLRNIARECRRLLRVLEKQLARYNALTGGKRSFAKLWQQVRFGNGMMKSLNDVRLKVSTYTSALTIAMNLLSIGSQGRVERYMYAQGGELREMRHSINWITATMQASHTESSILTSYTNDDKAAWKQLRRELVRKGFSSSVLKRNKGIIKKYLLELGQRGVLDERLSCEHAQDHERSESPDTARSESNSSDSEQVQRHSSSPPSKVSEGDQYDAASGSKDKGKAREFSTEDTQASEFRGISSHKFAIRSKSNKSDAQAENNGEESDHCAGNVMSSETTNTVVSDKPVLKSTFVDEIQDIDSLEGANPNCDIPTGPLPETNDAKGESTPKGKGKGKGKQVLENSSETTHIGLQRATSGDDALSKTDKIHKESNSGEAEPCETSCVKVFSKVVDLEDGSEYPVMATYLLPPPTVPRPPPKIVSSEWFQWRDQGNVWRITEFDQAPPKQIPGPDPKIKPSLPRVVVVQAGQKEAELQESKTRATDDFDSKFSNQSKLSPDSHSHSHRAKLEARNAPDCHLRPPRSPEVATFVGGDKRARTRTMYYRDVRGRGHPVYHNVRRTKPVSHLSGRRGAIYYSNTKIPRALWQPHSSHADKVSDEEDWVDDSEGPCIIEVSYTNEREPRVEISRPHSRSRSLPRAAAVVVDSGRRGICYYRGYYRNYYRSTSRCDHSRNRYARSRSARSRSVRSRSARSRSARSKSALSRSARSMSARSRSECTSTIHIYERTIYYGRRQSRPVYEYDGRRGTIFYAHSRSRVPRRVSGYRPARLQRSTRRSSVVRRRITRTTTF
jgi:hypothetical protein